MSINLLTVTHKSSMKTTVHAFFIELGWILKPKLEPNLFLLLITLLSTNNVKNSTLHLMPENNAQL